VSAASIYFEANVNVQCPDIIYINVNNELNAVFAVAQFLTMHLSVRQSPLCIVSRWLKIS